MRITRNTYPRLCEYDALLDVHFACARATEDKGAAKAKAARDHPDMYVTYMLTRMGES